MNLVLEHLSANFRESPVLHTRWTGGFTGPAGQTAIQMSLCGRADGVTFQHLFDEINSSSRAVEFIAQQLIGGAGGRTKTAVHTFSQDGFRGAPLRGIFHEIREISLHGLHLVVQAARIEDPPRVEGVLESLMKRQNGGGQGMEGIRVPFAD